MLSRKGTRCTRRWIAASMCACLTSACAAPAQGGRSNRLLSSADTSMGYEDAVALGADYVSRQGYPEAELQTAERLLPNIWCVRFGLAPKGSGRALELYFDGQKRTLIKKQETSGASASWVPSGT